MYLLDTCVFSEFVRKAPDLQVLAWAKTVPEFDQYLSVVVLGELLRGIELLPSGGRQTRLRAWVDELFETHHTRIVPVDQDAARVWARICAAAEVKGRPPAAIDSLIAASALSRGLTLVTRNVDDYENLEVPILNPWDWRG